MNLMLIILPTILVLLSQLYINNCYKRYSKVRVKSGYTGSEVARKILDTNGLSNVRIERINGTLTDNFNSKTNVVSLSSDIYDSASISSVAVAAHECGHVIQHRDKYLFIVLRGMLVPIVNLSSKLGYFILLIGFISSILDLAMLGLIFMAFALVFQLITLPCEFDASSKGKNELIKLGIIENDEVPQVKSMLMSAALTYVASFFANILELLRLYLSLRRNDRR